MKNYPTKLYPTYNEETIGNVFTYLRKISALLCLLRFDRIRFFIDRSWVFILPVLLVKVYSPLIPLYFDLIGYQYMLELYSHSIRFP